MGDDNYGFSLDLVGWIWQKFPGWFCAEGVNFSYVLDSADLDSGKLAKQLIQGLSGVIRDPFSRDYEAFAHSKKTVLQFIQTFN